MFFKLGVDLPFFVFETFGSNVKVYLDILLSLFCERFISEVDKTSLAPYGYNLPLFRDFGQALAKATVKEYKPSVKKPCRFVSG